MSIRTYPMHINFEHLIEDIESMRINDIDTASISPELSGHEQLQETVYRRENAINKITEGLSELKGCGDGGNWRHIDELSVASNNLKTRSLFGNYPDLVDMHAGYYFSQNEIRTKELDWFYADLLIAYTFKRQVTDSESWVADIFGGAFFHGFLKLMDKQFLMASMLVLGKLVMWAIVGAAIVVPVIIADSGKQPLYMVFSAVALFHVLRVKYKKDCDFMALKIEAFKNVWAINRVYSLTSSEHIHWDILGKELDSTREQGVKWLPSLYTAVKNVVVYRS